jgi:hypothetical protein
MSNGHKIDQIAIKYSNKAFSTYPILDFWFENIPSGNPDVLALYIWLCSTTTFPSAGIS